MRRGLFIMTALVVVGASSRVLADDLQACGDAFEQAQVRRDEGKLLDARRLLRVCSAPTCAPSEQKLCLQWGADIDVRLPSFVPSAKNGSGGDLVDVKVMMDGVEVATKLDGRAVDADPGVHSFVFVLPDGVTAETKAVAEERGKGKAVSVTFGQATAPLAVQSPTESTTPDNTPIEPTSGKWSAMKIAGVATGGAGVVGLGLGALFGGLAISTRSSDCPNKLCIPGAQSTAYTQGDISTAGFVLGGVLLAGGAAMFLLAPKGDKEPVASSVAVAPLVGPAGGGVALAGRW
jgi:hypothetical protein